MIDDSIVAEVRQQRAAILKGFQWRFPENVPGRDETSEGNGAQVRFSEEKKIKARNG